ncbi:MAG: carboxypeptidase regulatory-like domain-containing protein [Bacteroidota bacterium]|nr:carboxypeptidase regulatory-like domain-containing protein [Bacteroidota bacterium]
MLKRILFLLTIVFSIGQVLQAQITTSSITGTIRDAGEQALAGATVVATHQPSGTKYSTVSQSTGQFTISNMRVGGPYLVVVSYVGYDGQTYDDIFIQLAEATILNSNLIKSTTTLEQVVVTSTARNNILNANRTGATTNIGTREIQRMPSITRSINDLARLTPQANGASVGGGNYRQNFITIDGSDFNNTFGIGTNLPAGGSPISLDALEEISVSVTPFDIRQSGFIGSALNGVTRAGTNNFNGSVYRYWRTQFQQGNEVNNVKFIPNVFDFEQYGARLGGPIIKNKLFFFLNYETENQPRQVQNRVAATTAGQTGSNIARPTRGELDMISEYLQKTYGYETGPYDNYSTEITRKKFLARLDWNISPNHRFNVRYNQVEGGEPNPPSTSTSGTGNSFSSGAGRTDVNALWFKNSNYFQGANFYSFAAELNSVFGKKIANTLRGTYTFQDDSRTSESSTFPFVDILKDGSPFTSFGYEPFSFGNLRKVTTYSFVDNLTWTLNNNNITIGAQADFSTTINGFQRFATSYYRFDSWDDFVTGKKPTDFAYTYSLSPGFEQAFPGFKFAQYSLYAQDEITINPRFRLTAGIRFDQPSYPDVTEIKTHPLVADLTFAEGEKLNTGNLPKASLLISPRLGFNWDVAGDRSFQIRGGTGIFTGRVPFVWIVSQSGDAGLLQVTQSFNGLANTPGPFNPDPRAYYPATTPPAGTVIPGSITALDEDFKFPQTWKSSIALDKRIAKGLVFTLEGILNKDINTTVFRNANLVTPQPLNVAGYPDNRVIYPNATNQKFINPLTSGTFNAVTNPKPSTPVPNGDPRGTGTFNAIVLDNGSKGYYASVTAKLERQFTKGLYATVAYTKSIASNLFDGGGDQPLSAWQSTSIVNQGARSLDYAGFVIPDRVIASVSYRKEYLRHLGTTVSLFYEGSIQGRFSYVYGADFNRDGFNGNDLIYIPKDPSEITFVTSTYNGVSYTAQQQSEIFFRYIEQDRYLKNHKGQYAERNGAQTPWRNQIDVKILQDVFTNIGKRRNSIQFSLDIFNVGNLINSDWGIFKTINTSSLLVPTNFTTLTPGGATRPTFRLASDRGVPANTTFRDNVSVASTYFMQFGLRYIFGN